MPPETIELIVGIAILLATLVLTRRFHAWKIKRACSFIVNDLKAKSAFDPASAVELPYAKRNFLKMGMRDYRPTALNQLVMGEIVARTDDGRYYLKRRDLSL